MRELDDLLANLAAGLLLALAGVVVLRLLLPHPPASGGGGTRRRRVVPVVELHGPDGVTLVDGFLVPPASA